MTTMASGIFPNLPNTSQTAHSSASASYPMHTRSSPLPSSHHHTNHSLQAPAPAPIDHLHRPSSGAATPPPKSPSSVQSSPYVSPRPHDRVVSDSASTQAIPLGPLLRRGAVSGASGPLSFPPLPTPFRHASAGPGDGTGMGRLYGPGAGFENGPSDHSSHGTGHDPIPPGGPSGSYSAFTSSGMSQPGQHWSHHSRLPPFSSAAPSGSGPHFPLPSSYSLSSTASAGGPGAANGILSSPPSIGALRRGGLSASSGIGVYGAAASVASQPYWSTPGPVSSLVAGYKRKQTSANPPPRNYPCHKCPASFSRRHDLNRHSRIHLAVKPFGCPNCQKTFSRKDALKRHLMVKGCGKDAEGRPKKRRGRKSAAEKASQEADALKAGDGAHDVEALGNAESGLNQSDGDEIPGDEEEEEEAEEGTDEEGQEQGSQTSEGHHDKSDRGSSFLQHHNYPVASLKNFQQGNSENQPQLPIDQAYTGYSYTRAQ